MNNEMKNVRLVKVDTKNFDALIDLEVNEEQKNYVARNIYSLAEAYATKSTKTIREKATAEQQCSRRWNSCGLSRAGNQNTVGSPMSRKMKPRESCMRPSALWKTRNIM